MRGKPKKELPVDLNERITPADAGKTATSISTHITDKDHPRGCGENSNYADNQPIFLGSPPRMRGKLLPSFLACLTVRITPADAGKTSTLQHPQFIVRDHPRGCGENVTGFFRFPEHIGSPPRMRGKRLYGSPTWEEGRITPADAGKT